MRYIQYITEVLVSSGFFLKYAINSVIMYIENLILGLHVISTV